MENNNIIVLGNYMPSNYNAARVVDVGGVAPTVMENHGTITAIFICKEKKNEKINEIIRLGNFIRVGSQSGMVYGIDGIYPTICACPHGWANGYILEKMRNQKNIQKNLI